MDNQIRTAAEAVEADALPKMHEVHCDPKQRKATKKIEVMIKQFEESYAVRDKQDVLAMCALQFASQVTQQSIDEDSLSEETASRLDALCKSLDENLT